MSGMGIVGNLPYTEVYKREKGLRKECCIVLIFINAVTSRNLLENKDIFHMLQVVHGQKEYDMFSIHTFVYSGQVNCLT